MASSKDDALEEQFVLRCLDQELAAKLRGWLQQKLNLSDVAKLMFTAGDEEGKLIVDGITYPVTVQALPTIVESYKTYDDINLVKTADIGQVLVVGHPSDPHLPERHSSDGVTPALHGAEDLLRIEVPPPGPALVAKVERDILDVLAGKAPYGVKYTDVEEVYHIDKLGRGEWRTA